MQMSPDWLGAHNDATEHRAWATCHLALDLSSETDAPEWIELLPPGPVVRGRDGRQWLHDQPQAVLDAFQSEHMPLVLDWEHASEFGGAGPSVPAPAAGWIEALELRDGSIWGQVSWNAAGQASVVNREYRFISPAFHFHRESNRIVQLLSVALTNRPNLRLGALNDRKDEYQMDPQLRLLLGLAETATAAEVCTAISALQTRLSTVETERDSALNRAQTPDLARFVPRSDYDVAIQRAVHAEEELATQRTAALDEAIETAINQALTSGKITPATVDFYRASCRETGGLERFATFVAAAPTIAPDSGLDQHTPPGTQARLTAEQRAMCASLGLDEAAYLASVQQAAV